MYKKLLSVMFLSSLFAFLIPATYADTLPVTETTSATTESIETTTVDESVVPPAIDPVGKGMDASYPYYGGGITFTITVESSYTPINLSMNANYSVFGETDKAEAKKKLEAKYSEAKAQLAKYGAVTKTNLSVYDDYPYVAESTATAKKTVSGYLDVNLKLTSSKDYEAAKAAFDDLGFASSYLDIQMDPEVKIDIESKSTGKINSLISKKKKVYEKILGYSLGKINSLYIDTWPDSYRYNAATNTVPVTVTTTVGYEMKQ